MRKDALDIDGTEAFTISVLNARRVFEHQLRYFRINFDYLTVYRPQWVGNIKATRARHQPWWAVIRHRMHEQARLRSEMALRYLVGTPNRCQPEHMHNHQQDDEARKDPTYLHCRLTDR